MGPWEGVRTYTPEETRDNHTPARAAQSRWRTVHDMTQHMHTRHASPSTLHRGEGALSACTHRGGETDAAAAFGAGLPSPRRDARMLRPASGSGDYTRWAELDAAGKSEAIKLARAAGKCSTCTGEGNQNAGFVATVIGVKAAPSSGANGQPPVIDTTVAGGGEASGIRMQSPACMPMCYL